MALGTSRRGAKIVAASLAVVAAAGVGTAVAAHGAAKPPSNKVRTGVGINEYGMTRSYFDGKTVKFTYTKGFYCDKSVKSKATTGCEAGATYNKPPAADFDPLYITVPLGFSPKMNMECPNGLVCVDHPGTIDLTRLEPALKPLYPSLSNKQLTDALKNFATPGHDHYITTLNGGKPEWWNVDVVGVESAKTYQKLENHGSAAYLFKIQKHAKKYGVTGTIPTNLFLYFGVHK